MGILLDLCFEESGRMAREAERRYNQFMNDHPYIERTSEIAESVVHPNRSATDELSHLLEPNTDRSEDLGYALDANYEENTLDSLREDLYND